MVDYTQKPLDENRKRNRDAQKLSRGARAVFRAFLIKSLESNGGKDSFLRYRIFMNSIWDLKEYILLLDLDDVYIFYKGDFSFSFVHLNFLVLKTDSLISNIFRSRYFSKDTAKKYDEWKSFHVACRGNRNNRNLHRLSNCMSYSCNNITFVQLLPKEKSVSKGSSPILFG